jgi:hypothetical protein
MFQTAGWTVMPTLIMPNSDPLPPDSGEHGSPRVSSTAPTPAMGSAMDLLVGANGLGWRCERNDR